MADLLLKQQTPCNKTNSECGNIALYCAVKNRNASMIALLLKHGAHTDVRNKDKKTPYMLAKELNAEDCIELLKPVAPKNTTPSFLAFTKPKITPIKIDSRKEAEKLYEDICENIYPIDQLPFHIKNLLAYYRSLLEEDLINLKKQREIFKPNEIQTTTNSYLTQNIHTHNEIVKLNKLTAIINDLLDYPEQPISIDALRDFKTTESKDVIQYVRFRNQVAQYHKDVKEYLINLQQKIITKKDWRIKNLIGQERIGVPTHISELQTKLQNLPENLALKETLAIYADVMNTLSTTSILRHEDTIAFDTEAKTLASNVRFTEANAAFAVSTLAPPPYHSTHPSLPAYLPTIYPTSMQVNYQPTAVENTQPPVMYYYNPLQTSLPTFTSPPYPFYMSTAGQYLQVPQPAEMQNLNLITIPLPAFNNGTTLIPVQVLPTTVPSSINERDFYSIPPNVLPSISLFPKPPIVTNATSSIEKQELKPEYHPPTASQK